MPKEKKIKKEAEKETAEKKAKKTVKKPAAKEVKPKKVEIAEEKKEEKQVITIKAAEEKHEPKKVIVVPKKRKEAKQKLSQYYGTGGRKTSVARVWLTPGEGNVEINGKQMREYLGNREVLSVTVMSPFDITQTLGKYDARVEVSGGGVASQADAIRHGISNALNEASADFRSPLKKQGFLTRDPRIKERKKYGRKRARKRFQYSKR